MNAKLFKYLCRFLNSRRIDLLEEAINWRTRHVTVVLDDIYQSQNVSAVLRTCECFGIQDVHIVENEHKYEVNKKVVKGAVKWLTIENYNEAKENTRPCLEELRSRGYKIAATTLHPNSISIDELTLDQPVAIVLGSEKSGVSETAFQSADYHLRIPMYGFTESFNVSVAAALILQKIRDRINLSSLSWRLSEDEKDELKVEWAKKCLKNPEQIVKAFYEHSHS